MLQRFKSAAASPRLVMMDMPHRRGSNVLLKKTKPYYVSWKETCTGFCSGLVRQKRHVYSHHNGQAEDNPNSHKLAYGNRNALKGTRMTERYAHDSTAGLLHIAR